MAFDGHWVVFSTETQERTECRLMRLTVAMKAGAGKFLATPKSYRLCESFPHREFLYTNVARRV